MSTVAKPEEVISSQETQIASLTAAVAKLERENKRLTDELTVLLNRERGV
jgi:cell division protein FtsB